MTYILFHIPHASLKTPKKYWKICVKDKNYIQNTNIYLSDILTDKLVPNKSHKLIFKYSRLFCDVERFKEDAKEIMSKKGIGVIYTKDCNNTISIPNNKYEREVIQSYYNKHHNKLDKMITNILKRYNKYIIIDFHSFSEEIVKKLFNTSNIPEIYIGTDGVYTDQKLLDLTVNHFKSYGYSVAINHPYSGTMIPNKFFNKKEKRLSSIMLEINKKAYLKDNNSFNYLKQCIEEYYKELQNIK